MKKRGTTQVAAMTVAVTALLTAVSGCGVLFAIDECDPSENLELSEMTTEELDALCGNDRGFVMGHE